MQEGVASFQNLGFSRPAKNVQLRFSFLLDGTETDEEDPTVESVLSPVRHFVL